jgi:ribosomal protein L30
MNVLEKPFLKIKLVRGLSRKNQNVKLVFESLGLRKINQTRVYRNTPSLVGQINKVIQFVQVEELDQSQVSVDQ